MNITCKTCDVVLQLERVLRLVPTACMLDATLPGFRAWIYSPVQRRLGPALWGFVDMLGSPPGVILLVVSHMLGVGRRGGVGSCSLLG